MSKKLYHTFISDVISGKKLSCKFVKQSVDRHINDLKKKDFDYKFDEDKADRVIRIIKRLRHTGGSLANQQFDLQPFQAFMIANIFGWVRKDDGLRRFKKVYIETAKKSGKSEFMAALQVYMAFYDREEGAQVYTAATKRPQADHVFRPAKIMMRKLSEESPKVNSICRVMRNEIQNKSTNSFIKTLTSDSATEDGMNVHCGVADEYHAHTSDAILANMESGAVSREQALIMIITTAGFNKNGPCYEYRKNVVEPLLDGAFELESLFAIIFTVDEEDAEKFDKLEIQDITKDNLKEWEKANPNIGITPKWQPLIQQAIEAKKKGGQAIVNFKTKSLNIWVDSAKQWIASKDWNSCGADFNIEDFKGRRCYGGLDLSKVEDLTAFSLLFIPTDDEFLEYYSAIDRNKPRLDNEEITREEYDVLIPNLKFHTHTFYYCPESKINGTDWTDGVDYQKWVDEGYIKATSGNVIDYEYIQRDIEKCAEMYDIQYIEYDRYLSHLLVPNLIDKGINLDPFGQGFASMSQPCKDLFTMVKAGSIIHNNNPITEWHIRNAITSTDPAGNIKIDKQKGSNKVDGVVAMVMAIGGYTKDINEYKPDTAIALLDGEIPVYD